MSNIIWLTTQFPSSAEDTKGSFIFRTVRELAQHYEITVICLHTLVPPIIPMIKNISNATKIYKLWRKSYPSNPKPPLNINFKVIYAKYIRLPRSKFHHIEGWFGYFGVKKYLKNLINEDSLLHATWLFPAGDLANIIAKKYKVPFVVTLMGSDVHFLKEKTYKWNKAIDIINNANYITSVSQELYVSLENKNISVPENKKHITHTIYEFDSFNIKIREHIRNKYEIKENEKIVFYAGTLRKLKNVNYLIESIKLLKESNIFIKLIVAGTGEEEGNLKALVKKTELEKDVSFVGGLKGDVIVDYYNIADVFCLPSKNEGLPNVIIESLLCGIPVVASSVGEIPHIIENGKNGYLVKPNSVKDLEEKLEKAIKNDWDREELRKSIADLSPGNVIEEYKNVYKNILN